MAFAFTCVFACGEKEEEKTVAIEETAISLEVGEEKMLQASKSEGVELEWSSSDAKVATVSNGKVTAVGAGQAVITVTIKGTDIKDEVTVTVTKSAVVASKVEVSGPTKVEIGSTAQYKATVTPANAEGTVAWSVSDAAIAEIDQTGKFTAKAVGSVKVVATIGEVKAEYAVTVSDIAPVEPTEIQLWVNGAQIENGGTLEVTEFDVVQLEFKYLPADKPVLEGVDVASGNEYTVAIDEEYKLTAVAPGDTYVLVSSIYAEIEFSINVHVVEKHFAPESIVISGDAKLEVNEEGLVSAVVSPERASQEVVWSSSDEAIAVVDPTTGVVTGKGIGKATITAKSTEVETVVATYEVEIVAEVVFDRTLIYVNPAYTNKGEKVTVDGKELIVGKNAVDTVAKALKNVAEGGQIVLAAGVYADAITFNKNNVTILGPNAGVNAAEAERAEEANLAGQITVAAGVTGAAIDGVLLSDSGAVLLEDGVDGFALQYCVIGGIGQDGVVRGPEAETEVKNIKMNYNYSESYTSYRFGHFRGVINGIEMIGNNLTCKGSYDFINVGGVLKGTVVIENNTYTNSNQSFIYVSNVGVLDCTISGNIITNITNTFIDLRNMKEDGAVKIDIYDNEFKDSVIGWMPIRIRTADYDANDSIVVNVYDNIFSEAFSPDDDGINYYINNPSYDAQVDPFKAIYVIGKNLFIENGQVVTEVNNTQFCNAAISFETPYASLEEMNGGASTPELPENAAELLQKFADEMVELFNNVTISGKLETTQKDFADTTHPNVKEAFGTAEALEKYKWFLEFVLEEYNEIIAATTDTGMPSGETFDSVRTMLEQMIAGNTAEISGSHADGRTWLRQFIHRLINVYNAEAGAGKAPYNGLTIDFANDEAKLAKFLQLYLAQQEAPALSLDKVVVAPAFENEAFELDGADYQVGVNAFTTIAEAVAAVNENGVVLVLAGEYAFTESVTVNKAVQILGPNAGKAVAERVAEEAVINHNNADAPEYAFIVAASNVVISGFKVLGYGETGTQNKRFIALDATIENLTVSNNYTVGLNSLIEYYNSLTLSGVVEINDNILEGHAQFVLWVVDGNDLSGLKTINFKNNKYSTPADSYGAFGGKGAFSFRNTSATCEIVMDGNEFDFTPGKTASYFAWVASGKLVLTNNTFKGLTDNLFAGAPDGSSFTSESEVKDNKYLDADGNETAAAILGGGLEEYVPEPEIQILPVKDALALGAALASGKSTEESYTVVGKITSVTNTQYGNFYITDDGVNSILVYGLYQNGVRYDKLEYKPVVGDTVTLYCPINNFNGQAQLKNAELVSCEQGCMAVTVDPNGEVKTIAEALEKIDENGTVTILAGTYEEELTIAKAVNLVAEGEVVLTKGITLAASNVTLKGLKITAGTALIGSGALENLTVEAVTVEAAAIGSADGMFQFNGYVTNIVVKDSVFTMKTNRGIRFEVGAKDVQVYNCKFDGTTVTYDQILFYGPASGKIVVKDCSFKNSNQSLFKADKLDGAEVSFEIINNTFETAANVAIDIRTHVGSNVAEAKVSYNIARNLFSGVFSWGTIRLRAAGLTEGNVAANINNNKFIGITLADGDPLVQQAGAAVSFNYINADNNYCDLGAYKETWVQNCLSAEGWYATEEEYENANSTTELTIDLVSNFNSYSSTWSGYASKTLTDAELGTNTGATVEFSRVSKQSGTITDKPVIGVKNATEYVTVTVAEGSIKSVEFDLQQWTTKTFKKIVIEYFNGSEWVECSEVITTPAKLASNVDLAGAQKVRLAISTTATSNTQAGLAAVNLVVGK